MKLRLPFDSNIFPQKKGIYIVGGSIRDILLGHTPTDFDIVAAGNLAEIAHKISSALFGRWVVIGKPGKQVLRIVSDALILDLSQLNGDSIIADLKQRDFTVNAMAYSFDEERLIDPTGGKKDLAGRTVRMVSNIVFARDPIRLLRAFRISAALGFKIEPDTLETIRANTHRLRMSANERIKVELFKLLECPESYPHIRLMQSANLLCEIFPDLRDLIGCTQNRHHAYDVFEHTLSAYRHLENLFRQPNSTTSAMLEPVICKMDNKKKALLKYALILHDIGKPWVKSQDEKGNTHFYGHGRKSAEMAAVISRNLTLSVKDICYITEIINHHNHPRELFVFHINHRLSQKALIRFFLKCRERTPDILLHAIADHLGKGCDRENGFIEFVLHMIRQYDVAYQPRKSEKSYITGHDLIDSFGLKPSPLFQKILTHIRELQMADEIKSREEALAWVNRFLSCRSDSNA